MKQHEFIFKFLLYIFIRHLLSRCVFEDFLNSIQRILFMASVKNENVVYRNDFIFLNILLFMFSFICNGF